MKTHAGRRAAIGLAAALIAGAPACSGAPVIADTPTVGDADDQQATCKVAKDPLNPLIVEWPGTSKVDLDTASQRGVVVVSYAGCVLKILTSCSAGGGYDFHGVTPVRDKIVIDSESELYARLPLGVASLKGELASAQRLELEYVAVGQRLSSKPPATLSGDCRGATHYVRTIMVGAYGLDAMGKASVGAAAGVGDVGAGAEHAEQVRRLRGSGAVQDCASGAIAGEAGKAACNAILQLGLAPLMAQSPSSTPAPGSAWERSLGRWIVDPRAETRQMVKRVADAKAVQDIEKWLTSGSVVVTSDSVSAYVGGTLVSRQRYRVVKQDASSLTTANVGPDEITKTTLDQTTTITFLNDGTLRVDATNDPLGTIFFKRP